MSVEGDNVTHCIEGGVTKVRQKGLFLRYPNGESGGQKLRHRLENSCIDYGVIKRNYISTIIYLLIKGINLATKIGVSNLKDEIEKISLVKLRNNVKDILYDMSSNYTIFYYY